MKENVLKALEAWILRVTDEKAEATPAELAALPEVAGVVLLSCGDYEICYNDNEVCLGPGETVNLR